MLAIHIEVLKNVSTLSSSAHSAGSHLSGQVSEFCLDCEPNFIGLVDQLRMDAVNVDDKAILPV